MVESPDPLTCQSVDGSPGFVFSQAITLVTGGPQGPAAAADPTSTRPSTPTSAPSIRKITERRIGAAGRKRPMTDITGPPRADIAFIFGLLKGDAHITMLDDTS